MFSRYKRKTSGCFRSFGICLRTTTHINKITFRYEICFATTITTLVEFDEKLSEENFFSSLYPFEIQWCFRFSLIFYPRINFFRHVSNFFSFMIWLSAKWYFILLKAFFLKKVFKNFICIILCLSNEFRIDIIREKTLVKWSWYLYQR